MSQFLELSAFVTVVDRGSFSAASECLEVAKSAVSKRVTQLEKRLGVLLLQRTTRSLSLTESGRVFYEQAKQILNDIKAAEASITNQSSVLQGNIRIAAPLSFGLRHLSPAIHEFMAMHPELNIDLDLNDRQVNVVEDGFDLVIRIGELPDSSLIARRLAPIKLQLLASPEYIKEYGQPQQPKDLLEHKCLSYTNMGKAWKYVDKQDKEHSVNVPISLRANNGDMLLDAAISGLGLVMSPTFIAHKAIENKQLLPVMTDYHCAETAAYAIYPHTRFLSNKVRSMIDFLAQRFGEQPYWDDLTH